MHGTEKGEVQTVQQEEYRNKTEYYKNPFPEKGSMKGGKGWRPEPSQETTEEQEMPTTMKIRQMPTKNIHMEGSSNRAPRLNQFIENPFAEALREEWKPPSPPEMPLMTQPKAGWSGGDKEKKTTSAKVMKHGKGKVLKQRMVWVMSSEAESEEDKETQQQPAMKEDNKVNKNTKKCMQWIEVDENQRVKLSHFI